MVRSRKESLDLIIKNISALSEEKSLKKIFFVHGSFGIGKSYLLNICENEINGSNIADAVLRLEQSRDMGYLPEFLNNAILTYKASYSQGKSFLNSETAYNMSRYLELLNLIKTENTELFEDILTEYVLKSDSDLLHSIKKHKEQPDYKENLKSEIRSVIKLKGDQRLLLETSKVVAESFIVDLMTNFFPEGLETNVNSGLAVNKKKIVFILDNFEHISGSINKWLFDDFFKYCYNKKFSEFIAYNISHLPVELKVSDFFDFTFLISGRKSPVIPEEINQNKTFSSLVSTIFLDKLTADETNELIAESNTSKEISTDNLLDISFGIPYLMTLWLEFFNLSGIENDNGMIYLKASESILKYCSEEQKDWVRCASFLHDFDENGLRCYSIIADSYKTAYNFFENSPDFAAVSENSKNRLKLNHTIKEIISEAISIESFQTAKEYIYISRMYNEIKDVFNGLNSDEVNVARSLAYFYYFDENNALPKAFQTDIDKALNFVKKYNSWFEKTSQSFKMKAEISEKLTKFNKLIDKDKQLDKLNLIGKIWEEHEKKLKKEILDSQEYLPKLNQDINSVEKENSYLKSEYDTYQKDFIDKENNLIDLRKKLTAFSFIHSFVSSGIHLLIAIVLYFGAHFFPDLIGNEENQDSVRIIQYIMWFVSGVFVIISFMRSVKGAKIYSRKKDLLELKSKIAIADAEKQELQNKMKLLKEKKENIQKRVSDAYERLKTTNNRIKENQEKLNEPYINS